MPWVIHLKKILFCEDLEMSPLKTTSPNIKEKYDDSNEELKKFSKFIWMRTMGNFKRERCLVVQ